MASLVDSMSGCSCRVPSAISVWPVPSPWSYVVEWTLCFASGLACWCIAFEWRTFWLFIWYLPWLSIGIGFVSFGCFGLDGAIVRSTVVVARAVVRQWR